MTDLQQSRYDQLLRRVGDLKGPGSKVNDVLSELFPTIDVENIPGELLALAGIDICFGGGTIVGAAGEAPRASLENPAESGKLVTLTRVYFSTVNTGIIRWGIRTVSLGGAIGTELFRDTRKILPQQPTAQVHQLSSVALANATNQVRILANTPLILNDENGIAVLAPGTNFEIGHGTNTATIVYGFNWRERIAEPSELNF